MSRSLLLLSILVLLPFTASAELKKDAPTVLITGANRGIGLELARQYADKGWNVIATSRHTAGDAALAAHVKAIASYDDSMRAALMMPDFTPPQLAARNDAIAGARSRLGSSSRRRLTPDAVQRIDALLGLPKIDPALGVLD